MQGASVEHYVDALKNMALDLEREDIQELVNMSTEGLAASKSFLTKGIRFSNGLEQKYNIELEDARRNFYYAGGDTLNHSKYFELRYGKNKKRPERTDHCCCGAKLVHNCYITKNDKDFYVVGSCCIEAFLPNSKKTCDFKYDDGSLCMKPHRNRKVNLCNTHKQQKADAERNASRKICDAEGCNNTHRNRVTGLCNACRKKYILCPKCDEYGESHHFAPNSKICIDCNFKFCRQCGVPKNNTFRVCFLCNKLNKMENPI